VLNAVLPPGFWPEFTGPIGEYAGKTGIGSDWPRSVDAAVRNGRQRSRGADAIFGGAIHPESMMSLEKWSGDSGRGRQKSSVRSRKIGKRRVAGASSDACVRALKMVKKAEGFPAVR